MSVFVLGAQPADVGRPTTVQTQANVTIIYDQIDHIVPINEVFVLQEASDDCYMVWDMP